jgi:hypothetical protein
VNRFVTTCLQTCSNNLACALRFYVCSPCKLQCRINHNYGRSGICCGRPRFWPRASLFYFFLIFFISDSARGPNNAPERGPKEPKSPRKLEAPKNGPQTFSFFPVLVSQRGAPKSPRSPENVIGPQNLKMEAPKLGAPTIFLARGSKSRPANTKFFVPSFFGQGAPKSDRKARNS